MTKKKKDEELDEELQGALRDIVKEAEEEDYFIRKAQIKTWKKNEEFWHGVQYLFWNEKNQTWISPTSGAAPNSGFSEEEMEELGPFYDFVIDIYTAHGESIISALSSQLPAVRFLPDDAMADEDVDTAKTYDKISDLVARHNNAKLKFIQALFYLWTGGLVAAYRYTDTDKKYGVYRVPHFEEKEVKSLICPECNYPLGEVSEETKLPEEIQDPQSDENFVESKESNDQHSIKEGLEGGKKNSEEESGAVQNQTCPQCGNVIEPQEIVQKVPLHVYDEEKPKSRVLYEVYGPLFIKIPIYAFNQDGCGYLGFYLDKPKDELIAAFCYDDKGKLDEEKAKKIESEYMINDDRWARNEYQYPTGPEQENKSMTTLIQYWIRPSKFNACKSLEKREKLLKEFPTGCKVVFVGKTKVFISAKEEDLDRRWSLGKGKLSTYIHADPIGRALIPIQEMRNQLDNLIMDTIEHGMPSTFADSEVIDFDAYGKFEAMPGYIFKAKARPGQTLAQAFYTEQKAQVPREVGTYRSALDKDAQFTVGSFPSLYGGPSEGKSRTLGEYNQSRQQALQRLTLVWVHIADFYRRNQEALVRMFAEIMIEDEHFTTLNKGSYITTWIKKSQMNGKIGGVESEASDAFPISLQQKQAFLTHFIEMNNPIINQMLFSPENRTIMHDVFLLDELKLQGANQGYKQQCEINQMMKNQGPISPAEVDPMTGKLKPAQSSVPIDPLLDDDAIHIAALKDFMVDDVGLQLQKQEPLIYADFTAHLEMHQRNLQLKVAMPFEKSGVGQQPDTSETSEAGGDQK